MIKNKINSNITGDKIHSIFYFKIDPKLLTKDFNLDLYSELSHNFYNTSKIDNIFIRFLAKFKNTGDVGFDCRRVDSKSGKGHLYAKTIEGNVKAILFGRPAYNAAV